MISAEDAITANWDQLLAPLEGKQRTNASDALRRLSEGV
jgi:hypothetical protein